MTNRKSEIVVDDGQEYVETEDARFGLGLQLPAVRTMAFPSLATKTPLLSMEEIKRYVESEEFTFGRALFDTSWITNQNGYGSCAGYGGASALAKARVCNGQDRKDLSGDYLYSLVNGGRDRGSMLDDNMRALTSRGVCLRSTVPLGGIYRSKYNTQAADREALRFRGFEAYALPDEQSMATALMLRMPVVIAIHVGRRWRSFDGDDFLAPSDGPGNHCEHCDDIYYDRKRGCFAYRKATSHGKNYSDDGYCWTTWDDHYKTANRYHQFYAIPGAIDDPQGDNPSLDGEQEDDNDEAKPLAVPELTITSSSGCKWCRDWERNERPKAEAAGYELSKGDVPGRGVPRFRLTVGAESRTKIGFWAFDDIAREAAAMQSKQG